MKSILGKIAIQAKNWYKWPSFKDTAIYVIWTTFTAWEILIIIVLLANVANAKERETQEVISTKWRGLSFISFPPIQAPKSLKWRQLCPRLLCLGKKNTIVFFALHNNCLQHSAWFSSTSRKKRYIPCTKTEATTHAINSSFILIWDGFPVRLEKLNVWFGFNPSKVFWIRFYLRITYYVNNIC